MIPLKSKIQPIASKLSAGLPLQRLRIPGVKHTIIVSSAKGGVGKSTTAVNLAVGLNMLGLRVGLLDADIMGPSIPMMMAIDQQPDLFNNKLVPVTRMGVDCISMGMMVKKESAVVAKAMKQLLWDVKWNSIDILVIDSPPGTGDIQLTITQQVKLDGALIVSTPQDIALLDVVRGIEMFKKVDVKILGLVQNMSYFECSSCHTKAHIFGDDGARKKAKELEIDVLADIPLSESICLNGDTGTPIAMSAPESSQSKAYVALAKKVAGLLNIDI